MRNNFQNLRIEQLDRALHGFLAAQAVKRPAGGWIHAIRKALGISSAEVAHRLGTKHQLVLQFEKGESEDRITLRSLRSVANALDCDLVYALVPRAGSLAEVIEARNRSKARQNVLDVEHSMRLEDQASGQIDAAVESELKRIVQKRTLR